MGDSSPTSFDGDGDGDGVGDGDGDGDGGYRFGIAHRITDELPMNYHSNTIVLRR